MKNHTSECSEVRERLPLLPGGDLEAPLAEQVEAHLAVCASCSAELQRLRAALSALAGYQRRDPAIDIWSSVRERLVEGGLVALDRTVGDLVAGEAHSPVRTSAAPMPELSAGPVAASLTGTTARALSQPGVHSGVHAGVQSVAQSGTRRSLGLRVGVVVALAAAAAFAIWFGSHVPRGVVDPMGAGDGIVLGPLPTPSNTSEVADVDSSGDFDSSTDFDPSAVNSPSKGTLLVHESAALDVSPVQAGGLRRAQGEERLREVAVPFDASTGRPSNVTLAADREVR